ncbi:TPA: 2-hydroxyacyl-CoA dehydratase, partial [Enterococcus faecalis]|nr:2-hydroxyacyl-CoA dehydratase [Enterococcus faecalis]
IQPFDDLNAVIVTVENSTGNRPVNIKVTDTVVILERQEGTLDVFK